MDCRDVQQMDEERLTHQGGQLRGTPSVSNMQLPLLLGVATRGLKTALLIHVDVLGKD